MLFDPSSHEPLTGLPWEESRARAAIADIAARTEAAFDEEALWPAHPLDVEDGPLERMKSLYLGAAGVIWSLHELERVGAVELRRDWRDVATGLADAYLAEPDFPDVVDGPVPSLWMGEAGILLVAHTLAPAAWQEQRLLEAVHANVENPTWELMWGSPGTMLAAQVMHERTGDERWREAWNASADRLWEEWRGDLWRQDLYGAPPTSSARRTGLPATSSCSPAETCSTPAGERSSSGGSSRRSQGTRCAPTGSHSGLPRWSRARSHGARSGATELRASWRPSPAWRPATTCSTSSSGRAGS